MDLRDQVAVVTGGRQGIGQGVCLRLARTGARVAIVDRDPPDETMASLTGMGVEAAFALADVSDAAAVKTAFEQLEADLGVPSVLVNAAGIFADIPFLDTPVEVWDAVMNINARGMFLCSQEAARRMRAQNSGRIVNILSTASAQGFALESAYCASKGAALLLTRVMAVELAQYGIAVNGVGPGTVQTAMGAAYLGEGPISAHELGRTPMGRFGEPGDIAEAVTFFASTATWVTGQVLYVDGGFMATGLPVLS
jgi:NAD(P)-dependent dehydrogenase (short-subunit alcohol dehydrogenase family)